ncbi:SAC3/GANP domain-containingprotein [Purpureocillium lavendulum]|uniref:SAC3/GANP domain-containingprotein n=1 Tax=Purpureocillium lavendulum TaxID=1247861 RepID=A0AB34G9U5_9HYPO|nr:SAC3/GANP domain-containingprotein [Purpureocillium lavendulum]
MAPDQNLSSEELAQPEDRSHSYTEAALELSDEPPTSAKQKKRNKLFLTLAVYLEGIASISRALRRGVLNDLVDHNDSLRSPDNLDPPGSSSACGGAHECSTLEQSPCIASSPRENLLALADSVEGRAYSRLQKVEEQLTLACQYDEWASDEEVENSGSIIPQYPASVNDNFYETLYNCSDPSRMTFKFLEETYEKRFQYMEGDARVRIAVLDTGLDMDHADFALARSKMSTATDEFPRAEKGEKIQKDRIKGRMNFCGDRMDRTDVSDGDGHGTFVASVILRLAPQADLFIARVCNTDPDKHSATVTDDPADSSAQMNGIRSRPMHEPSMWNLDPDHVAKAVDWAIEQKVNIINLSLGYGIKEVSHGFEGLRDSLQRAVGRGIIVLAAAANDGNHKLVAWPAREKACAISIHSCNDYGTTGSPFSPQDYPGATSFTVLGENVMSRQTTSKGGRLQQRSGTSVAASIASAIVGLLLAYMRQTACIARKAALETDMGPNVMNELESLSGMTGLLNFIRVDDVNKHWIPSSLLWRDFDETQYSEDDHGKRAMDHAWIVIREAYQAMR